MAIHGDGASSRRAFHQALGLAFAAASLSTPRAFAQDAAPSSEGLNEVVVTGSRIRGVEPTGSAVIALDRDVIVETGAPTTSDLIRKLPQIVGLGASETASGAQNGAANATRGVAVNLRG